MYIYIYIHTHTHTHIYIYIYELNHLAVYLKLTQHCKSTILQLKKKFHFYHLLATYLGQITQIFGTLVWKMNIRRTVIFLHLDSKFGIPKSHS